jgi:hypothetical protein
MIYESGKVPTGAGTFWAQPCNGPPSESELAGTGYELRLTLGWASKY